MDNVPMGNYKFRISNPEQSERLQKVLFGMGYDWVGSWRHETKFVDKGYLYTEPFSPAEGAIEYGNTSMFFEESKNKEQDVEAFIAQHTPPVLTEEKSVATATIDKHYSFDYKITEDDIKKGIIKIDPYFVSQEWQLGAKDNTGVIFHCLKTLARFGVKNSKEREITALYKQIMRLAELEGIILK